MPASKYRLGERIGAGGMAEVFRATARDAQGRERAVAIKRLLPEHAAEPKMRAMFGREAQIMARVRHPNLVALLDVEDDGDGDDSGVQHLVMELVEGTTLDRLAQRAFLPLPVVLHVMAELLTGLAHLHALADEHGRPLGLVHRDVSPRNVLVSRAGEVKLGDFGLARDFVGANPAVSAVRGTPCYMSPEQVQGLVLDGRSDLFSAGVIFWELLTRTRLFAGEGRGSVFAALLHTSIRPPGALRPEVPAEVEAVSMRLLERDRRRRYQGAQEALDALRACAARFPVARRDVAADLAAMVGAEVSVHSSHSTCVRLPPGAVANGPDGERANGPVDGPAGAAAVGPAFDIVIQQALDAPGAAAGQAAPGRARRITAPQVPAAMPGEAAPLPGPDTRGRLRWLLAAGALLFLGNAAGWLLVDQYDGQYSGQYGGPVRRPAASSVLSTPLMPERTQPATPGQRTRAATDTALPVVRGQGGAANAPGEPARALPGLHGARSGVVRGAARGHEVFRIDFFVKDAQP